MRNSLDPSPFERTRMDREKQERTFRHRIHLIRWRIEHFFFTGYAPRHAWVNGFIPSFRYFAHISQPKHNWPLAIWWRNMKCSIEQYIKWK